MGKLFYSIANRTKIAALIAIILIIVLAKNIWEANSMQSVNQSLASIYNDRLLPTTYIFKITNHLYQKRLLLEEQKIDEEKAKHHNNQIQALLNDFANTHLVKNESKILNDFKINLQRYNEEEQKAIQQNKNNEELNKHFNLILIELEELSKIQTSVGNDLKKETNKIAANSSVLSNLEISMIIILGLIIQVLIFVSKTTLPKPTEKHQLN